MAEKKTEVVEKHVPHCGECGLKIRGKNHAEGEHHRVKARKRGDVALPHKKRAR